MKAARYAQARTVLNDMRAKAIFKKGQEPARKKVKHRRSKETPISGYIKTVHAGVIHWSALPSQLKRARQQEREIKALNGSRNRTRKDGSTYEIVARLINRVEFPRT